MRTLKIILIFTFLFILYKGYPQQVSLFNEEENMVSAKISPFLSEADPTPSFLPPPPCNPSATNDNCASAVTLTSGSACTNGTLCSSGMQSGEVNTIGSTTITESVWYTFQATAASMYVDMNQLSGTCFIALAVYGPFASATAGCLPVLGSRIAYISASSSPIQKILNTNGLTTGQWYMIQAGTDGSCGVNGTATFCISITTPLNCSTCPSPCGTAKGYTVTPSSYDQLKNDGACYPMCAPNDTIQKCYTFTSWDDSVSVSNGGAATGGCGGFTTKEFSLYSNSCLSVSVNSTGSFTSLTTGDIYTICYFLIMSSSCNIDTLCPYYRQTNIAPLPVELLDFTAEVFEEKIICKWSTASEWNNDYYTIERNIGMMEGWNVVGTVKGAGNSSTMRNYSFNDTQLETLNLKLETIYYRLRQTDFNGEFSLSKTVSVIYDGKYSATIFPNPFSSNINVVFGRKIKDKMNIDIENIFGRNVFSNTIALEIPITSMEFDLPFLREGIYFVRFINGATVLRYKIIKS